MAHLPDKKMAEHCLVSIVTLLCFATTCTGTNATNPCWSHRIVKAAPLYETEQGIAVRVRMVSCWLKSEVRGVTYPFDIGLALNTYVNAKNSTLIIVSFWFGCLSPMQLYFINPLNVVNKNIILSLSFTGECKVITSSLVAWAEATDFREIDWSGRANLTSSTNLTLARVFKEISLIRVYNSHSENLPSMFTHTENVFASMEDLTLNNMSISRIPEQWKSTMPRLQYLNLYYNNLTQPPRFPWNNSTLEIFRTLRKTEYSIEQDVRNFGVHVARNIYVRGLDLSYNKIEDLSSHQFRGFLHIIHLEGNGLKSVGPTCFSNLRGIQTIDLRRNKLTSLPKNLFQGLSSLLNIFLGKNNLSFLEHNLFEGLENIKRIHLEHNNLASFPDGLFRSLRSLEVMRLDANKITKIEQNPFPKHSGLRWLNLRNNKLSSFPSWIFGLMKIEVIDLSFNELTFQDLEKALEDFDQPIFSDPLKKTPILLNLSNNNISTLIDSAGLEQIKVDRLISPLRQSKFVYFWKAYVIKLSGNPLACDCIMWAVAREVRKILQTSPIIKPRFDTWICDWPYRVKGKSILELGENQWMPRKSPPQNCPPKCFCQERCLDGIVIVDCEERNLTKVPSLMPQGIIELNLINNEIKDLPAYSFLTNVTVLKLTNNKIDQLQTSVLQKLRIINVLLIDSNKLTSLPREIESMNFTELALDQNMFKCNCTTKWMKQWLLNNKLRIRDVEKVLCKSENALGQPMYSLPIENFTCHHSNKSRKMTKPREQSKSAQTITCFVFGGLLFVTLILVTLLYKYHRDVKVFMFTHFNWHPFDRIDDSDQSKIYDAFISYHKDDLPWVVDTLLKGLETQDPFYKICFQDRDFIGGAAIDENILKSVDQSKRMLMVLSPSFARSEWCLLEFRAAHRKVLEDRMNYLIIILFDDVDVAELDDEIKLYMRSNTYVGISDKWFWQKLFYAMPQRNQARVSMENGNQNKATNQANCAETMQEINVATAQSNGDTILLV